MINILTIALTHVLLALAALRLLSRDELDVEDAPANKRVESSQAKRSDQTDKAG